MEKNAPKKSGYTAWEATELVWDLMISIVVPTILCALAGRWLDQRYHSTPLFLLVGLGCALGIIAVIVVRKGKDIAKRL